jgi:hypothetical protein
MATADAPAGQRSVLFHREQQIKSGQVGAVAFKVAQIELQTALGESRPAPHGDISAQLFDPKQVIRPLPQQRRAAGIITGLRGQKRYARRARRDGD